MDDRVVIQSQAIISGTTSLLTSTTATVLSSRFRLTQTSRPNQAARSHMPTATIRNPVVLHQSSSTTVSKLDPSAHHPQIKSEKGMLTAVASKTGRTVLRRRKRNAGGMIRAGTTRTSNKGKSGKRDGAVRGDFWRQSRQRDSSPLSVPKQRASQRRCPTATSTIEREMESLSLA